MPTDAEIREWLAANDNRARACAKHFGVPVERVRSLARADARARAREPEPTAAKPKPTAPTAPTAPPGTWGEQLAQLIADTRADIEEARESKSWIAVKDLRRDLKRLLEELRQWRKDNAAELADSRPEEEILDALLAALRDLPPAQLEAVYELAAERLGLRVA